MKSDVEVLLEVLFLKHVKEIPRDSKSYDNLLDSDKARILKEFIYSYGMLED